MKTLGALILIFGINTYANNKPLYSREDFDQVLIKNKASFLKCYIDEFKKTPGLEGKLILNWDIEETGEVKTANLKSSTVNNKRVENCFVNTIKTIKFPEAPKGTTMSINHPFYLGVQVFF